MSNTQSGDFLGGLQDAVRQNPVSAALVGMGILWMFTGGNRITAAAALLGPAARAVGTGVGSGLQNTADAVGSVTEGIRSAASHLADKTSDTLSDASEAVGATAAKAFDAVKDTSVKSLPQYQAANANGFVNSLQGNLKNTFEQQPLLLGAIGLAIGAGMAAGLPRTDMEAEFAGEAADRVTAQVKDIASEQVERVTETAKRTFEAVKDEAAAQGLTGEAVKEGAAAVGEKLKVVAQGARGRSKSARNEGKQ